MKTQLFLSLKTVLLIGSCLFVTQIYEQDGYCVVHEAVVQKTINTEATPDILNPIYIFK